MGQGSTFSAAARVEAAWLSSLDYESVNGAISYVAPKPPLDPGCSNTCSYASNGICMDGGEGAEYEDYCELGTDCEDCGPRVVVMPPAPPPPPSAPELPRVFSIRALSLPLTSTAGDCTVVITPCEACRAGKEEDIGGTLVVSYRAPVNLDAEHTAPRHSNLVEVQFLHTRRKHSSIQYGAGSDLYASLRTNDAYYVPWSGLAVAVCSHDDLTAQVAFAYSPVRLPRHRGRGLCLLTACLPTHRLFAYSPLVCLLTACGVCTGGLCLLTRAIECDRHSPRPLWLCLTAAAVATAAGDHRRLSVRQALHAPPDVLLPRHSLHLQLARLVARDWRGGRGVQHGSVLKWPEVLPIQAGHQMACHGLTRNHGALCG